MTTINPAIIPKMRSQLIGGVSIGGASTGGVSAGGASVGGVSVGGVSVGGASVGGASGLSLTVNELVKPLTSNE